MKKSALTSILALFCALLLATGARYSGGRPVTSPVNDAPPVAVTNGISGVWTVDFTRGGLQSGTLVGVVTDVQFIVDDTNTVAVCNFFLKNGLDYGISFDSATTSFPGDAELVFTGTGGTGDVMIFRAYMGQVFVGLAGTF